MPSLTPEQVLGVWEAGREQHPVDRALTMLLAADSRQTRAGLAELSIAERDRRLFVLRAEMLGPTLPVFSRCPACRDGVEVSVPAGELAASDLDRETWEMEVGGLGIRFRLPNSRDLAAAAACGDLSGARRILGERCTLEVNGDAETPVRAHLSEPVLAVLSARMGEVAPNAEVLLGLSCPGCGTAWQEALDIAGFFWTELAARAQRVLREVDTLARAYHWSEADILAMSPARRQNYLDLLGA